MQQITFFKDALASRCFGKTYLIERRRNVRGDNLGHGKRDAHHDQQFAVQRRKGGGQRVSST